MFAVKQSSSVKVVISILPFLDVNLSRMYCLNLRLLIVANCRRVLKRSQEVSEFAGFPRFSLETTEKELPFIMLLEFDNQKEKIEKLVSQFKVSLQFSQLQQRGNLILVSFRSTIYNFTEMNNNGQC